MSVALADNPVGLYAPSQDNAVSPASSELRASIAEALEPPRATRQDLVYERVIAALRKGSLTEGVFVAAESLSHLCDVLAALPGDITLPEIVVESDHEIALDWQEGPRRALSLTIDQTPYIGFAALIGHEPLHGRVPFAGTLPETLNYLLARLYPKDTRGRHSD